MPKLSLDDTPHRGRLWLRRQERAVCYRVRRTQRLPWNGNTMGPLGGAVRSPTMKPSAYLHEHERVEPAV